jgi:glycosyltransferase involved in cell wall biosynthesis
VRVVYLNPSGQMGGAEASLLDLLASLRAAKPDWSLHLIAASEGPLISKAKAIGVAADVVPFPAELANLGDAGAGGPAGRQIGYLTLMQKLLLAGPAARKYVRGLHSVLNGLAPDLLHTNGLKMHLLGVWSRPSRVPVIWHVHDYISSRPVMARLLRRYANGCAAIVTNSKSVACDVQKVCEGRIYTVYNGIDLTRFSPTGPSLDLDLLAGLPRSEPSAVKVGLLATLARWKGHEVFLRAFQRLEASLPVRGYVIGGAVYQTDGSQHSLEELRAVARRLGVSDKIGFTGFVDEPAAALRALDIVVHASTQPEPFGLVIAQAMACGRALIVSQAGGAAEIVDIGVNALGHPPGDAEALAGCIEQLVRNAELRTKLGQAGRATAIARFDRMRLAAELIPVYRQAIYSS